MHCMRLLLRQSIQMLIGQVVPEASAVVPGWNNTHLYADHLKMNKYSGPTDRSFTSVAQELRKMCDNAEQVIRRRKAG